MYFICNFYMYLLYTLEFSLKKIVTPFYSSFKTHKIIFSRKKKYYLSVQNTNLAYFLPSSIFSSVIFGTSLLMFSRIQVRLLSLVFWYSLCSSISNSACLLRTIENPFIDSTSKNLRAHTHTYTYIYTVHAYTFRCINY